MNSHRYLLLVFAILVSVMTHAQNSANYQLSSSTNGTTMQLPSEGMQLSSDGVGGTYSKGTD